MRAFGHLFATLDDIAWGVIVIALGVVLLVPQVATTAMPYYHGTIEAFALQMMIPAVMALVGLTMLAALFSPVSRRSGDRTLIVVVIVVLGLLILAVFGLKDVARTDVPSHFKMYLLSLTAFAVFNFFMLKGEQFRASAIAEEAGASGSPLRGEDVGRSFFGEKAQVIPVILDVRGVQFGGGPVYPMTRHRTVIEHAPPPAHSEPSGPAPGAT